LPVALYLVHRYFLRGDAFCSDLCPKTGSLRVVTAAPPQLLNALVGTAIRVLGFSHWNPRLAGLPRVS
jgi:hypothetical protein